MYEWSRTGRRIALASLARAPRLMRRRACCAATMAGVPQNA